jgi:hypothetical protein
MDLNILGRFNAMSQQDVELEYEDWKSATNAVEIYLKQHGWDILNVGADKTYKTDNCTLRLYNLSRDSLTTHEIILSGKCNGDYNCIDTVRDITKILQNRYIVLSGQIVINKSKDTTDRVIILLTNSHSYTPHIQVIKPNEYLCLYSDKI